MEQSIRDLELISKAITQTIGRLEQGEHGDALGSLKEAEQSWQLALQHVLMDKIDRH